MENVKQDQKMMNAPTRLRWDETRGRGYYPVHEFVYDKKYFEKYVGYSTTNVGKKLLTFRTRITKPLVGVKGVLDVGIGSGAFINQFNGKAAGYDVNPTAIDYLKEKGKWCDFYNESLDRFSVITFFDSLEHIDNLEGALQKITDQKVIISMPVFRDLNHLLSSKHFRIDEHFHYFTEEGFIRFMKDQGFRMLQMSDGEIKAGREDIYTFVFERYEKQKAM